VSYVCPNGHPVELVLMVACEAEGCMASVAYEPTAHGLELHRRLQEAETERDRLRAEVERWQRKAAGWKARIDAVTARLEDAQLKADVDDALRAWDEVQ
jgi:phage shock protein A